MYKMEETSGICEISDHVTEPSELLCYLINRLGPGQCVFMNLATLDNEFGILSRSIVYRGIIKDDKTGYNIMFATERNCRNYENMKSNSKVAITFLFPEIINLKGTAQVWQVRLFDAEAIECDEEQISAMWSKEPLYCKIRSQIAECGKPADRAKLIDRHDRILKEYKCGKAKLDQTKTFTVFKVTAKRWDFYMSERFKIGDRIQYRRNTLNYNEKWQIMHVDP